MDLERTLDDLPTEISGIDIIEVLVVDDGSSDRTREVAANKGVKHCVRHSQNRGLPQAINTGVGYALDCGADLLVNTDADNQYKGEDIVRLIEPILSQTADYVYGERIIDTIEHFSPVKKLFQKLGAAVVSMIVGFRIMDAASGFRALNREAMRRIFLLTDFASPLESLIQARMKKLGIAIVPVEVNETTRASRIVKSLPRYIFKSAAIILDNVIIYRPLQIFFLVGMIGTGVGLALWIFRYILVVQDGGNPHLTLLVLSLFCFVSGVQLMALGIVARILRANRLLNEQILYRLQGR